MSRVIAVVLISVGFSYLVSASVNWYYSKEEEN